MLFMTLSQICPRHLRLNVGIIILNKGRESRASGEIRVGGSGMAPEYKEALSLSLSLSLSHKARVLMQRLSYPTETVLSNRITRNIIVPSFKDRPRKPLGRRPAVSLSLSVAPKQLALNRNFLPKWRSSLSL